MWLVVKHVHFAATKDSLSRHFNKFGEVLKAVIVTDPRLGNQVGKLSAFTTLIVNCLNNAKFN